MTDSVIRDHEVSTKELTLYFCLTIGLAAIYVLGISTFVEPGVGRAATRAWYSDQALVIIWTPLISAVVCAAIFRGKSGLTKLWNRLCRWRVGWLWGCAAFTLPVAINLAAMWVTNSAQPISVPEMLSIWVGIFPFLFMVMFGEEVGWRGYALPALQGKMTPFAATAFLGVLWGCWHYPVWYGLFLGINPDPGLAAILTAANTLNTIGLAFLFTWIANNTGASILLATAMHAANNATLRLFADSDSGAPQLTAYVLTLVIAAVLVLRFKATFFQPVPQRTEAI